MGACNTFCSKTECISQIQPDTEKMTHRNQESASRSSTCRSSSSRASSFRSNMRINSKGKKGVYFDDTVGTPAGYRSPTPESTPPPPAEDIVNDFRQAVLQGANTMVMYIQDENPDIDLIKTKFENGDSCLQTAVKNRKHDVIEYILNSGASPNEQNADGDTAIHLAARNNDLRSVELLLKFGASKHIENKDGELPVTIADELHYDKVVDVLGGLPEEEDNDGMGAMPNWNKKKSSHKRVSTGMRGTTIRIEGLANDVLGETNLKSPNNDEFISSMNTKRLNDMTNDVYLDITDSLRAQKANLFPMEGWMDKKQHSMPYSWQKRWVVMHNGYLLWSERQMNVGKDGITRDEKKRWDHCIKMVHITEISKIKQGKTQRKFRIKAKGMKETIFRAQNRKWRDKWVKELNNDLSVRKQERLYSSADEL